MTATTVNNAASATPVDPEFFGDHPALDLLNTVAQQHGDSLDLWQSDADVLRWFARQQLLDEAEASAPLKSGALLAAARTLRDIAREALAQRKANVTVDLGPLNAFLAQAQRRLELVVNGQGELAAIERYESGTAAQRLGRLTESVAQLLVTGDFDLVRKCEHPDCTLCFYDRTKSHRRRWCSMAVCGNRHKVASFRRRQQS
jgi:predicted RNA-binding Zn ribbon-like protein